MKLRIYLGIIARADYYCLLKGKKRAVLADLSAIVHTLAAAKKSGIVNYVALLPDTMIEGDTIDLDGIEEITAVLNRCKAYRREIASQLAKKVEA